MTSRRNSCLTSVDLTWIEGIKENWIRFGSAVHQRIIDGQRRVVFFPVGKVFAFVRWAANEHGTVMSQLDVLNAPSPGDACQTIPFVTPGAVALLRVNGWTKVELVLQSIDAIEALALDPASVSPDHWRHIHNRLVVGETPRAYSLDLHRAWLKRREISS